MNFLLQGDNRSGYFPKECVREEPECIGALDWCQLCLAERELHFSSPRPPALDDDQDDNDSADLV